MRCPIDLEGRMLHVRTEIGPLQHEVEYGAGNGYGSNLKVFYSIKDENM